MMTAQNKFYMITSRFLDIFYFGTKNINTWTLRVILTEFNTILRTILTHKQENIRAKSSTFEITKFYITNTKRVVFDPIVSFWHKGREVMERNDKYVFLYIYFTTRTIRYVFTGWVFKNDCSYRLKNRLLWTHNKRFMEPLFGVIAGGTAGSLQTKKEVAHSFFKVKLSRVRCYCQNYMFNNEICARITTTLQIFAHLGLSFFFSQLSRLFGSDPKNVYE